MILKASQRGGPRQLAAHLLNDRDNDHVTVQELRGFMAGDLYGGLSETVAIAKGTRCRQPILSLSLNPPKDAEPDLETLMAAANRAEQVLGLQGQPRAVVVHEKKGRRHLHVVWSRIDPATMKAVNLPFFKNRLKELSRELYLENGWTLPEGHRTNGWKNPLNFTLAEWQQAMRLGLDPREIKQAMREAWDQSDGLSGFRHALEEKGYYLARGDRRGFVAVDVYGEVYALARWMGLRSKDVVARLGSPDALPDVSATQKSLREKMSSRLRAHIAQDRKAKNDALRPLAEERGRMVAQHRAERAKLEAGLEKRRLAETRARAARINAGLRGVWDLLTGKTRAIRKQNEQEAFEGFQRDRAQRETLVRAQLEERAGLQRRIDGALAAQRTERAQLAATVAEILKRTGALQASGLIGIRSRDRSAGMEFEP